MSETDAIIYFETEAKAVVDRLQFYLDEDTRPDFEEEAPESEADIFNAIDMTELPEKIELDDDFNLTAWFDFIGLDDLLEICDALHKLEGITQCYVYFADDEEYKTYMHYKNGSFKTLYTYYDDDELDEKLWELNWGVAGLNLILKNKE